MAERGERSGDLGPVLVDEIAGGARLLPFVVVAGRHRDGAGQQHGAAGWQIAFEGGQRPERLGRVDGNRRLLR